jgi:hypothetical protein
VRRGRRIRSRQLRLLDVQMDFDKHTVSDLLRTFSEVLEELRKRGVVRSSNNPVADYTEYLVSTELRLTRLGNSAAGADAVDDQGRRYQIKGRRLTAANRSPALSGIRNLKDRPFDFLVAVIYNQDFSVDYAAQVPYDVVTSVARFSKHTNSNLLVMSRRLLDHPEVLDLTGAFGRSKTYIT